MFGSAVTRRQIANRPAGPFTATMAARPGEQVQIDSASIDVLVFSAGKSLVRADLIIAADVAAQTIYAAVLRPVGTKAMGAALLLAKILVPKPMQLDWADVLRASAAWLPHEKLLSVDARMREATTRPMILPEQVVIDYSRVFVSEVFTWACDLLGVSIQFARKDTPIVKAVVERTFVSIRRCSASTWPGTRARTPSSPAGRWRRSGCWASWPVCWRSN